MLEMMAGVVKDDMEECVYAGVHRLLGMYSCDSVSCSRNVKHPWAECSTGKQNTPLATAN